jgi:hypothetical protein
LNHYALNIDKDFSELAFGCTEKGKGKVVPLLFLTDHHAMKACWGSGGISPLIL